MTDDELQFVKDFQNEFITPMQTCLNSHPRRYWRKDIYATTMEEIITTFSLCFTEQNKLLLKFKCKDFWVEAFYEEDGNPSSMEHALWELLNYLEVYNLKHYSLPLSKKPQHFERAVNSLLKIVNSKTYGQFIMF